MSDAREPYNAFDLGTKPQRSESSATPTSQASPSRKQLLGSPVPEPLQLSAARRRAEWAHQLLMSDEFQQILWRLNERVMQEMYDTPMKDHDALEELNVRLKVISDFANEVASVIGEYEAQQQIKDQELRGELYGDLQTNPAENVI